MVNRLSIPYVGHLELDVELCGQVVFGCGVLVVRDPPSGVRAKVLRVWEMNVLSHYYWRLFGQHGTALVDLTVMLRAPSSFRLYSTVIRSTCL